MEFEIPPIVTLSTLLKLSHVCIYVYECVYK